MSYWRFKNTDWSIKEVAHGSVSQQDAALCVLMDIRSELKRLNELLNCRNFLDVPKTLKKIELSTRKRRSKRKSHDRA